MERIPATPGAALPGPGSLAPSPPPSSAELALPAAERSFGGGEPTFSALSNEIAQIEEDEEEEVTPLMRYLGLEESPWAIYGWIQNSFTANPSFPADGLNFGVNPNFKANQWMGNQYYMVIENPLEREGEFNVGGRLDILFGNDWEFNHMRGVFDGAWPSGWFPGLDLAQFYGEMHLPVLTEGGLDVKFGRWYTLHGYEVVPAIGRPLLSVPYMFNYGQPFTHWGLMTTWNVNDNLVIYNGAPQGWDQFQNANATWGYMGGFSWTGFEDKLNLTSIYSHNSHTYPKNIIQLNNAGVREPGDELELHQQLHRPVDDRPQLPVDRQADPGHGNRPGHRERRAGDRHQRPEDARPVSTAVGTASATGSFTTFSVPTS